MNLERMDLSTIQSTTMDPKLIQKQNDWGDLFSNPALCAMDLDAKELNTVDPTFSNEHLVSQCGKLAPESVNALVSHINTTTLFF